MSDEARRILAAALKLPQSERAAIAAILVDCMGDGSSSEEIEASWIAEAKRRAEAIDRGELELVDSVLRTFAADLQRKGVEVTVVCRSRRGFAQ